MNRITQIARAFSVALVFSATASLGHAYWLPATDFDTLDNSILTASTISTINPPVLSVGSSLEEINIGDLNFGEISAGAGLTASTFIPVNGFEISEGAGLAMETSSSYLISPELVLVPEPSAYAAILGAATLGLAAFRRRRRLSQKN